MKWDAAFKPWFGGTLRLRCKPCKMHEGLPFSLLRLPMLLHTLHEFLGKHAGHEIAAELEP